MTGYRNIRMDSISYSEHRLVWEEAYGPIPAGHVVHHVNQQKKDNRLENLQLMTYEEHARHHNDKHARIKTCVVCETEYTPHATKRSRQQACSPPCQRELMSARAYERYGGPHFIQCARCGTQKQIEPRRVGLARFCSRTCSSQRNSPPPVAQAVAERIAAALGGTRDGRGRTALVLKSPRRFLGETGFTARTATNIPLKTFQAMARVVVGSASAYGAGDARPRSGSAGSRHSAPAARWPAWKAGCRARDHLTAGSRWGRRGRPAPAGTAV